MPIPRRNYKDFIWTSFTRRPTGPFSLVKKAKPQSINGDLYDTINYKLYISGM